MNVVISQPMLFPWVGMLEQIRLADVFVDYSDVQFSKGSFVNRVQIKVSDGSRWLTVPLLGLHLGQRIDEVKINTVRDWRAEHLDLLAQAYAGARYLDDMLDLVRSVYAHEYDGVAALSKASTMALCSYYGLETGRVFRNSSALGIGGSSSRRVLDIVLSLGGTVYITGHGASRYLDHESFEAAGVRVEYIDYAMAPYPQLHGEFTPYVSALDLVANMGTGGIDYIRSGTIYWKDFIQ